MLVSEEETDDSWSGVGRDYFQFAIEGGWDVGAVSLCLIAAGIYAAGGSSHAVILLSVPMIMLQSLLLYRINSAVPGCADGENRLRAASGSAAAAPPLR